MYTLILAVSFNHSKSTNEKGSPGMCDQSQDEVSRRNVSLLFFLSFIMKRIISSSYFSRTKGIKFLLEIRPFPHICSAFSSSRVRSSTRDLNISSMLFPSHSINTRRSFRKQLNLNFK